MKLFPAQTLNEDHNDDLMILVGRENSHRYDVIPWWYFSLGWDFRIIVHSVKGLLVNVEASKNAWGLSFENVFILIQEITVDMVAEKWCKPFD